ncbi:MAG: hypothetical protein Ct9H300mP3_08550 [Gammaproteobacteria bacterium]|nr:MAG: hypothetical protein Ct9H300mP3_08550 [Gammaproteobacteria bacterium]
MIKERFRIYYFLHVHKHRIYVGFCVWVGGEKGGWHIGFGAAGIGMLFGVI